MKVLLRSCCIQTMHRCIKEGMYHLMFFLFMVCNLIICQKPQTLFSLLAFALLKLTYAHTHIISGFIVTNIFGVCMSICRTILHLFSRLLYCCSWTSFTGSRSKHTQRCCHCADYDNNTYVLPTIVRMFIPFSRCCLHIKFFFLDFFFVVVVFSTPPDIPRKQLVLVSARHHCCRCCRRLW